MIRSLLKKSAFARSLIQQMRYVRSMTPWQGDYPSLAEANKAIGSSGYHQDQESFVAYAKSLDGLHVESIDMHILAALKCIGAKTVLDYGGGLGNRYLNLKNHLGEVAWAVLEIPALVELGRKTFPEIPFVTEDPGGFDVALYCGVLQQMDNWKSVLQSQTAPYLIVENNFSHDGPDRVATRSGYAWRISDAAAFEDFLKSLGTLQLAWSSTLVSEVMDGKFLKSSGYLIHR